MKISEILAILIIFGIFLPSFSFGQDEISIKFPQNFQEIKIIGKRILETLDSILKEIWQGNLKIIQKIWQQIKNFWNSYIGYRIEAFWQKILTIFGKEIKKRKEIIKEEFPKEKEELKKEIPKAIRFFWKKFKELIK